MIQAPMTQAAAAKPLLDVRDLTMHFPLGRPGAFGKPAKMLTAVDRVTFQIGHGETLGLVGESGSGKTTAGRAVLRAIEPTAGQVIMHREGADITALDRRSLRGAWRHMQMIFQDPYASLNPRMTVREIIGEPLIVNRIAKGQDLRGRIAEIAGLCGLDA